MKKYLLFIFLVSAFISHAQNYQCLQSGVKHYFINGNGYLRGIRIDSVTASGDTTIYYPFRTPRGVYTDSAYLPVLDTNGGSWIGKRVRQLIDGTFIFDSYWGDSVIIKTQAIAGDSWVFYSDTSSLYYMATVLGTDTMSVLGVPDSVKKIMITAHDSSGILTADPVDSFQILLSKNNGFVQVFDLYTFPYHKPDSAYRIGLDFFLDRSSLPNNEINSYMGYAPNTNISIFHLIDFIIPNDMQLHNWNVGDVFEYDNEVGTVWPSFTNSYTLDTVISKTIAPHEISYSVSGLTDQPSSAPPFNYVQVPFTADEDFFDAGYSIVDTSFMPEQVFDAGNYVFYFPVDSGNCFVSPAYNLIPANYFTGALGGSLQGTTYKLGIGELQNYYIDGNPTYENYILLYDNRSGTPCGSFTTLPEAVVNITAPSNEITIFPNPAIDVVYITAAGKINTISISNLIGQQVLVKEFNADQAQVNISSLPPGLYLLKINESSVRKFIKE